LRPSSGGASTPWNCSGAGQIRTGNCNSSTAPPISTSGCANS
jgi:hypothetical protein